MHCKLKQLNIVHAESAHLQVNEIVCSIDNKACMYGDCENCVNNEAIDVSEEQVDKEEVVWWWQ